MTDRILTRTSDDGTIKMTTVDFDGETLGDLMIVITDNHRLYHSPLEGNITYPKLSEDKQNDG